MADAVVDDLEPVEVEKEHGKEVVATPFDTVQRVAQSVDEERPVRQPSKGIVKCVVVQAFFDVLAIGDVRQRSSDPVNRTDLVFERASTTEERPLSAVLVSQAVLALEVLARSADVRGVFGLEHLDVVRVHPAEPLVRRRSDISFCVTQHRFPA